MEKSFTINCLNDKLNAERILSSYNTRRGLGRYKDWDLFLLPEGGLYTAQRAVFAQKDNEIIYDLDFTNILVKIDG